MNKTVLICSIIVALTGGFVAGFYYNEFLEPARDTQPPPEYIIRRGVPSRKELDANLEQFLKKEEQKKQIAFLNKELAVLKEEIGTLKRQLAEMEKD